MTLLPVERILGSIPEGPAPDAASIGSSREGRPIVGYALGGGSTRISLIGGCHADEPVGPAMLEILVRFLASLDRDQALLKAYRWFVVPHVNPDGDYRNAAWSSHALDSQDHLGATDCAYDPALYVEHVVRELPGDDVEFGFPRDEVDEMARPENRAVAEFLATSGPFHLHGTFHGMGFAPGPWFLIESDWIERTVSMRHRLRQQVREIGYPLFDIDRQGEKGFHRIDEGFSTRPDSKAMAVHFRALGDEDTAALFRPSSMEYVRSLGGDPLTLVSEMPLFLVPDPSSGSSGPVFKVGTQGKRQLHSDLRRLVEGSSIEKARSEIALLGVRGMPIRDQMRLQLAFLNEAIACIAAR